jgi:hypothetical protein
MVDEFSLEHASSQSFEMIEQLICGAAVIPDENNIELIMNLIENLGNSELSELILPFLEKDEELSVSKCISRLKWKLRLEVGIVRECEFIASHFSDLKADDLGQIEKDVMIDILRSDSLRILNEDWLFELIVGLGPSYSGLIGEVKFEFLSTSSIDFFFEHFGLDQLDDHIWRQIWIRLRHRIVDEGNDTERKSQRWKDTFRSPPESPWAGLISHLSELCGGNVHEKGLVNITCSSTQKNQCWEIVNYGWTGYIVTDSRPNSWIQFDFKDRVVSLTHYALKSHSGCVNFFVQWILQGSVDGNTWSVLDAQNTQNLNGTSLTKIFPCSVNSSVRRLYRYIRLTQTGKASHGSDVLALANIEFFGLMRNSEMKEFSDHI